MRVEMAAPGSCHESIPDEPNAHELLSILSADEMSRAECFISRYFCVEPARIRFSYSAYGKPHLDAASSRQALHFNVSHSHGLALYAVASQIEVGIDLERLRSDLSCR